MIVPLNGQLGVRCGDRGATADRGRGAVCHPGEPLRLHFDADSAVFAVAITPTAVAERYRAWTRQEPDAPIRFEVPADLAAPVGHVLRGVRHLLDLLRRAPDLAHQTWFLTDSCGWIIDGLLHTQPHTHRRRLPTRLPDAPLTEFPANPHLSSDPTLAEIAEPARRQPLVGHRRDNLRLSQDQLADGATARRGDGTRLPRNRVSDIENERRLIDEPWIPHLAAELRMPEQELRAAVKRTKKWRDLHKD